MSVLAIDAGTTGVTALVVTPEGSVAARGYQEFQQHFPTPGWVEHSPEEIWAATLAATHQAVSSYDGELTALGITNQRETVLLWDRETLGSPRRAIVWQDRRTTQICDRLRDAGHEPRVTEVTGLRLDPYFSATKLAWIAEHEPHTWALVESGRYAVGTVESYLVARMTRGVWHVSDVSNACRTLLFDLAAGDWSDEMCALFGVPRDALPELVPNWGAPMDVPRPRAAHRRPGGRPAVGALRADLLRGRRLQVHLRHRVLRAHQHRIEHRAVRRRTPVDRRLAIAGRGADLRVGGRDLRDRRCGAVAARRVADRGLRGRDGRRRQHRARQR